MDKLEHEFHFWIHKWNKFLETKKYFNDDTELLLNENNMRLSDKGIINEAFAQKYRIQKEFGISINEIEDKKILEVGGGAVGFLETLKSKVAVGLDPLARRFHENNMINQINDEVLYLNEEMESNSLPNYFFDVIISRNCLDHTNNPYKVIQEMGKKIKKGGMLLLSTDLNHEPTRTEPLVLNEEDVETYLKNSNFSITYKRIDKKTYNHKEGKRMIIKAIKNGQD